MLSSIVLLPKLTSRSTLVKYYRYLLSQVEDCHHLGICASQVSFKVLIFYGVRIQWSLKNSILF
jgi:hypothetical protein